MKMQRLISTLVLAGLATQAHATIHAISVSYGAYANITDTNNNVLDSGGNNGSLLTGGTGTGTITGTRSDYNVTTAHQGDSNYSLSVGPSGIASSGSARSRTTYLNGGNSYLGQQTVSGFGGTILFEVDTTEQYFADLTGSVDTYHRAYEPGGPVGSFFNYFRLFAPGTGYLFYSQALNVSDLVNLPFSQEVTLSPGITYSLEFAAASSGVTVNYASSQAGPGAFGETAFTEGFTFAVVPEPGLVAMLPLGLIALRRIRRES